jgi:hypothetical protein
MSTPHRVLFLRRRHAPGRLFVIPHPGVDLRQRARLQVGRDRHRLQRANRHDAAAGRRLSRREMRQLDGVGLVAEIGHEIRDEHVAEGGPELDCERIEILLHEVPGEIALLAG